MAVYISKYNYANWNLEGYLNPYDDPNKTISPSKEAYTSGGYDTPPVWVQHKIDLSAYAGNLIKIRFVFDIHDQQYNGYMGWIIDDVHVSASQMGVSSVGGTYLNKVLP